MTDFRKILQY